MGGGREHSWVRCVSHGLGTATSLDFAGGILVVPSAYEAGNSESEDGSGLWVAEARVSSEWSLLMVWGRNRVIALHDVSVTMIQRCLLDSDFIRLLQVNMATWDRMSSPSQLFNQSINQSIRLSFIRYYTATASVC
jgi:hypothetical protein